MSDAFPGDDLGEERLAELGTRRSVAPYVAGVVAVALAALLWILATSDAGPEDGSASPLIGEVRPDVVAEDRFGEIVDLSEWDGEWIVVNFFATWCAACVVEHPELVEFENRHAEAGDAKLVSIAFDDTAEDVENFFNDNGGSWPVITDRTVAGTIGLEFGVARLPETFLISPDGIVVSRLVGGFSADQAEDIMARS